jgi:hypothetical protein
MLAHLSNISYNDKKQPARQARPRRGHHLSTRFKGKETVQ